MQREIRIPLSKCQDLIENADILLFRAPQSLFSFGHIVGMFTFARYSHVALAEKTQKDIVCLEFKEFVGSRVYPLEKYIQSGKIIDVYRIPTIMKVPYLNSPPVINGHKPVIESEALFFSKELKEKIIAEARDIINQDLGYGWLNIWKILLTILPFIRLFIRRNGVDVRPKRFVCSTLVSFIYRKYWLDLVHNIDDSCVTPGDISNSGLIQYLFTIAEV